MESRAWHERRCCGVVRAATVACVAGFVCAGGALIFFNRYLMRTLGFPFPALMVGYSALANSWICYAVVSACFPHLVAEEAVWPGRLTWRRFLRAVLPVGALLGAELTLSAIAMARLSLTLVEVFKANVGALVLLLRSLLVRRRRRRLALSLLRTRARAIPQPLTQALCARVSACSLARRFPCASSPWWWCWAQGSRW
jgi:hypothetical protein